MSSPSARRLSILLLAGAALLGLGLVRAGGDSGPEPLLVTSSLGSTSAILFVVDPDTRTLAAYEALPGGSGGLRLLGARKIDHDLRLTRYRDLSEFSHAELRDRYAEGQPPEGEAAGKDDR